MKLLLSRLSSALHSRLIDSVLAVLASICHQASGRWDIHMKSLADNKKQNNVL